MAGRGEVSAAKNALKIPKPSQKKFMAMDLLLYLGLFLAGTATFWVVYSLFAASQESKSLSWATGDEPKKSKSPLINISRPLVHQFTIKYALRFKSEKMRKDIDYKIVTAGMEEEISVDEFIGLKLFWGVLCEFKLLGNSLIGKSR